MNTKLGRPGSVLHVAEVVQGGIATHLNELLPELAAQRQSGHVRLILPADHVQNLSAELKSRVDLIPYQRSGRNPQSLLRLAATLQRARRRMRPDLIHAHSSFAGMISRSLPLGVPVVYCPNGWSFDMDASASMRRTYALIERLLAYRSAAIVDVSEAEKASAIAWGLPAQRLTVVHNGITSSRLRTEAKPAREGPIRLLFVGRFDKQKGLDWLLEVFTKLPPDRFTLQIVGAATQNFTVSIPDRSNIKVVGWQTPEAVDDYLDEADALIMPSRWEGFSLLALEAMRRGTALLVSDRSSLPEAVNWGECGHVFSLEQPQALIDFLMGLQRQQLDHWAAAGRQRFLKHFTRSEMHQKMEQVYAQVLAGGGEGNAP